jgi:hypothetical protein
MLLIKIIVIGFVYGVVLMENGMIGSYVYRHFENKYGGIDEDWRFKFWLSCEKCISGQLALWVYPFINPYWCFQGFIDHVFFICASILGVIIIKRVYNYKI